MSPPTLAALLLREDTRPKKRRAKLYLRSQNPTELYYERHELLLREARQTRLARRLRAARPKGRPQSASGRRPAGSLRRAMIALWAGGANIPFFRA
jgi:hypothetical protein